MAKYQKSTKVVGGFDTFKAAQRAAGSVRSGKGAERKPSGGTSGGPVPIASRINHTALPTKHEIMCYECGYEFQLTGRTPTTHCPKCRKMLEIKDHIINGEWSETVKTAGKVDILSDAVIRSGKIMATDIRLSGRVEGGQLQAYRWLELNAGAVFDEKAIEPRNLRIGPGANVVLKRGLSLRDLEVHGVLKADVTAEGSVMIKTSGCLKGSLSSAHLTVEEGGGIKGRVRIEPPPARTVPEGSG